MLKKILLGLLVIFIIAQFFRPEKNQHLRDLNEDFLRVMDPPLAIGRDIKAACYDCHSNYTNYPWYSNINPISYWMADHIKHGKGNLNFSEWTKYDTETQIHKLEEFVEEAKGRHMPIKGYLITHKEARLNNEQLAKMIAWVETVKKSLQ
ncbi:MAG: heme-binding domain-containing protein [Flavobacteriaceae bacterium]|nr:heme-binding domain-containing protein [Flavobacteriaceae bacterium]